jgi:hypothetical protein
MMRDHEDQSPERMRGPLSPAAVPPARTSSIDSRGRSAFLSHQDPARFDADAFHRFRRFLRTSFPIVHVPHEEVGERSLLYRVEGSAPDREVVRLRPLTNPLFVRSLSGESYRQVIAAYGELLRRL